MNADLWRQIGELIAFHKGLAHVVEGDKCIAVSGFLPFEASADGCETLSASFEIELVIPRNFPVTLPHVRELGSVIDADYHHRNSDGTFCLAVPIEQRRIVREEPTLLGFVNRLVIPYLYGYCFFKKHGRHPFDEAAHGYEGVLQHYVDQLALPNELSALAVISYLLEYGYRGHHDCPCGSGKRVRACHGPILMALHQTHNPQSLREDFKAILSVCCQQRRNFPEPLKQQVLRLLKRFKR